MITIGCIVLSIAYMLFVYSMFYLYTKKLSISMGSIIDFTNYVLSNEVPFKIMYYSIVNFVFLGLIGIILLKMRDIPKRTFYSLLIMSLSLIIIDIYEILSPLLIGKGFSYNIFFIPPATFHFYLLPYLIKYRHILIEPPSKTV